MFFDMDSEPEEKDVIKTVRILPEDEDFLKDNKISFTDIAREAIQERKKTKKKETWQDKLHFYAMNGMMVLVGIWFIQISMGSNSFFSWAITFGIGIGMFVIGFFNIAMKLRFKEFNFFFKNKGGKVL